MTTPALCLSFALAMGLTLKARRFQRTHPFNNRRSALNASKDIGFWEVLTWHSLVRFFVIPTTRHCEVPFAQKNFAPRTCSCWPSLLAHCCATLALVLDRRFYNAANENLPRGACHSAGSKERRPRRAWLQYVSKSLRDGVGVHDRIVNVCIPREGGCPRSQRRPHAAPSARCDDRGKQ